MSLATGRRIRMGRLIGAESNTCLICALDHAMTSPALLPGLCDLGQRVRQAIAGGAIVLILGRGMAPQFAQPFRCSTALALMLTASAAGRPSGAVVTLIGPVEEALRFGEDAVVVYVALAGENKPEMIAYLSRVGETCEFKGMSLIAEAEFPNAYQSLSSMTEQVGDDYLKRNARLCAELGAEIVKVNWSGDQESFADIVRACDRPVVLAGGSLIGDEKFLARMEQARDSGTIGCSVGRNIFEHRDLQATTQAISRVFRDRWPGAHAYIELRDRLAA